MRPRGARVSDIRKVAVAAPTCSIGKAGANRRSVARRRVAGVLSGARRNDVVVGTGTYPLPRAPDLTRREPDGSVRELARLPKRWCGVQLSIGTGVRVGS